MIPNPRILVTISPRKMPRKILLAKSNCVTSLSLMGYLSEKRAIVLPTIAIVMKFVKASLLATLKAQL